MTTPTKTVRTHDFRRTDLLERLHLQAVQGLLEAFGRGASQHLTSVFRQHCSFTLGGLEQVTWSDLADGLDPGMYFFTFSLAPLPGRGLLAIPTQEVLAFVDLRLAGTGEDDFSGRIPSEIDQAFLAPIIDGLIAELSKALARIQTTTPALEAQEANIQFVSVASPSEMCMAATCSFTVATRPSRQAVICLPFSMVRMLVDGLRHRTTVGDERRRDSVGRGHPPSPAARSPSTWCSSSRASSPRRRSCSPSRWGTAWASATPRVGRWSCAPRASWWRRPRSAVQGCTRRARSRRR